MENATSNPYDGYKIEFQRFEFPNGSRAISSVLKNCDGDIVAIADIPFMLETMFNRSAPGKKFELTIKTI